MSLCSVEEVHVDTETFIVMIVFAVALAIIVTGFFDWWHRQRCHILLSRIEELPASQFRASCVTLLVMHLADVGGDVQVPGAQNEEEEEILEELIELLTGDGVEWHEE